MKRLLLLYVFVIWISTIDAQTNVVHIAPGNILPQNHITYFLPKTEIVVAVEQRKYIRKAGRFANYAKRLLELDNIVSKDKSYFEINKITLYDRQIPDSAKQYAVEINQKSVAYKIRTDNYGIIHSINSDKSIDTRVLPDTNTAVVTDTIVSFDYSLLEEDALTATTEEKMAEFVAKQILSIRERRMELLTGEDERDYDGVSLKQMLDKLDETERKLTELFVGKTVYYTETKTFGIVPVQSLKNEVVFRFSSILGIVDKDDYIGEPVYISVLPIDTPQKNITSNKTKKTGIYYNVVANANIIVSNLEGILAERRFIMPQFGDTAFLPAKIFNNPHTSVEFTEYGSIKLIK